MSNAFKSLEFREGFEAYGEGVDGYAATPYAECSQEMTDWFAGWVAAKNADRDEQATQLAVAEGGAA